MALRSEHGMEASYLSQRIEQYIRKAGGVGRWLRSPDQLPQQLPLADYAERRRVPASDPRRALAAEGGWPPCYVVSQQCSEGSAVSAWGVAVRRETDSRRDEPDQAETHLF